MGVSKKFGMALVRKVHSVVSSAVRHKAAFTLGLLTLATSGLMATDPVTIPSIGTDVSSYISSAILLLGGVVGVAVGGYAAFLVVKKALKWLGRALG